MKRGKGVGYNFETEAFIGGRRRTSKEVIMKVERGESKVTIWTRGR